MSQIRKPDSKIGAGRYIHQGKYIEYNREVDFWYVYSSEEKIHELASRPTMSDCVVYIESTEFKVTGKPVFVVTDDFLAALEDSSDPDFKEAKELFRKVVKKEQARIKIIFVALIRRKIENLEKIDRYTEKIEQMITRDPEKLSSEQLLEFYKTLSDTMSTEVKEIGNFIQKL